MPGGWSGMRAARLLVGLAVLVFAASVAMFVVSLWTGELLGGPVYTTRLVLVLVLAVLLLMLFFKLDKGSLPRRLWSVVMLAIVLVVVPVTMETINAFLGEDHFSQDLIFTFYLLVFIPVLAAIGIFYFGFRSLGFEFRRNAVYSVLPSLAVLIGVTIGVLIVPMATGGGDVAVRISDIFSLVVQMGALSVVLMMAVTIGRGVTGRPYIFLSLALASIIVQTILTAHIRLVGSMSATEPADFFVHLGYTFLIYAAYLQYRLTVEGT